MRPFSSRATFFPSLLAAAFVTELVPLLAKGEEQITVEPHQFTLPAGYSIGLAVPSTLVPRPIHMAFDNEGVLYVTDSSGNTDKAPVQLSDPKHRVLRVIDRDGDGIFDESSVFAEGLPFPEGILIHEDSVYVSAPPHIWKLRDTDGDQVADERTSWFDGGSIDGCGNDLHGPYLGPDGFFYWTKGGFQSQTHQLANGRTHRSSAAHIYRARPDGSQLEVVITGGMNNPVGLAFSESGERFLSGTFFDLSAPGKRDGVLHAVYGGIYGRKNPRVLDPQPRSGDLLPAMIDMGPAAPSGIVMPRSDALGLRGDLLCADFNLRRISRHQLIENGSSYRSEMSVFLESDQTDFHPTDVIEDADGSLLVADTGSWYMICCPTSKVAKPHVLGGVYRVRKDGAAVINDPRGLELNWKEPQVAWLSDKRPAVVKRTIEALAEERYLEDLRESDAGLPALWALHRIPGDAARESIRAFLEEEDSEFRMAALHSAALWRDEEASRRIQQVLKDGSPRERRLAAMTLGRLGETESTDALLEIGSDEADPFLKHAAIYALFELGEEAGLPDNHPVTQTVSRMHEAVRKGAPSHPLPEIQLAEETTMDPELAARQEARLAELSALLPEGDPERGHAIFNNAAKSLCLTCHVMGEQGVEFGPDLTGIGSVRSERDLLEAIVFPSASIARYYEMVTVKKKKKGEIAGLIRRDTTDHLVLAAAPGVEQPVPIRDIQEAQYSNVSLMPEVFDALLKPREIADVVAYLKSEKIAGTDETSVGHSAAEPNSIPPHEPIELPGLHAYAQKSLEAGDELEVRVSSTLPYELSLVQLGPDPESREEDPVLESVRVEEPGTQPIHPGSYVHIEKGLPGNRRLSGFTLEGWIRPFRLQGWQGLITQHDYPNRCGIGLFLNGGQITFITDAGGQHVPATLHQTKAGLIRKQHWHHVAATWDGKRKRIYVDGELVGDFPFQGEVRPGGKSLRLGAYGTRGQASNFYDGDLAMCAVHDRALDAEAIQERIADQGLNPPSGNSVLGCWPFTEEQGTKVADAGPDGRDGRIINRGTWMIGGPSFDASAIDRHDTSYDPTRDENRGHGLRLASDELYNARWEVTHRFRIPPESKSGAYAARFDFEVDDKPMRYFNTFIVKRPESRPKAPLLVLVSSSTWLAYNSAPFPLNHGPELTKLSTGGLTTVHPKAATYSCYRDHQAGQPTYKLGLKLPWPAAGPNKTYINTRYSHLLRGERFLHLWLDRHGYEFDVITDHDLDRNPEILEGYQAVVLNGHSEYWSIPAYEGLDNYLKSGGSALVMSGNTMFWRVSFDETGEVMECRKFGRGIGGRANAQVGELYHSHDFKRGSLMRFCGYPAWKNIGLTCIGWGGAFQPYQVEMADHFLFQKPHRIKLKKGETFGYIDEKTGAVGHEFDVRLSTLQRATEDPVIKGLVEPEGITTIASSQASRKVLDFNAERHKPRVGGEETIAEIIYWERPEGGQVFHTGAIATAWGLYHDENLSKLIQNVLHHFGVEGKTM